MTPDPCLCDPISPRNAEKVSVPFVFSPFVFSEEMDFARVRSANIAVLKAAEEAAAP